ncbi:DUF975 family protein [Treponema ruminis]|uniref:Putative membrane protein n=1 Tax=Treponema ruminis TaxID=744515 RepID=A0A7W8LL60_9SPIR|nr:DUF975 family protein [Treponema ruminis]MBB5225167.1 putative membrane protein [Treponema ruminis]QSI01088.1 DUF975 family protein [Treponema ruminis]
MFNRVQYKKDALSTLKNNWSVPCLTAIVYLILTALSSTGTGILSACVSGIVCVGMIFTFMKMIVAQHSVVTSAEAAEKITFSSFLEGIETRWLSALLGSLWNLLWVFLWSLLFVIPGIVKAYSYSMMFYVLAENPRIGAMKAMDISKVLTQGHKANLFVMDMSFLGWAFLCAISCGIGFVWLIPYMTMTETYAYYDLKRMAFAQGKLTPADFEA